MRSELIFKWDDGYLARSVEDDAPGVWILDADGDPMLHLPDDLADVLLDDLECSESILPWFVERIRGAEQKAYQTGRDQGFGEGRRMVREALGLDALDRIANAIELLEARG